MKIHKRPRKPTSISMLVISPRMLAMSSTTSSEGRLIRVMRLTNGPATIVVVTTTTYTSLLARGNAARSRREGLSVVRHPAVVALYQNHGLDIRKQPPWTLDLMMGRDPVTVTATDPLRVRVDVQLDTDELRLTLNAEASVIDIEYAE
jgi:hypothetical protein